MKKAGREATGCVPTKDQADACRLDPQNAEHHPRESLDGYNTAWQGQRTTDYGPDFRRWQF